MRAAVLALVVWIACATVARADVDTYVGRPLVSVSVTSEGRPVSDPRLTSLVVTAPGMPLSMRDVRETLAHLFSLAVYEDVRVHASEVAGGVALAFNLVPLHPVDTLDFQGEVPGFDAGRVKQNLFERYGASPRASRAPDMARDVEQALYDVGYLRAHVTGQPQIRHGEERTTLVFNLMPGPRARIGNVDVQGNSGRTQAALLDDLMLKPGQPFERARVNKRIDRYLEARHKLRHYEAHITVTPTVSDDGATVDLRVQVDQGPSVQVVFDGDPVPADRRDDLVPIAREGTVDEDLLEDSSNRIAEFFRVQGYRDAAVPYTRELRGDELLVTFTVKKGQQYRVDAVDIAGNTALTLDAVQNLMRVRPGQPFSSATLDADTDRIEDAYRRLGYASTKADANVHPATAGAAGTVPVAIRITITENLRTTIASVRISGNDTVPTGELEQASGLTVGQPFSASAIALARDAIELRYANLGFPNVTVDARPGIAADGQRADVEFAVHEGPRVFIDRVLIVGNQRTRTETIERELRFKSGEPLGLEAVSESQRRLVALGLFRRARITELGRGDDTKRDVLVSVEEAPLTTTGYGGGFEVRSRVVRSGDVASEKLEFAPRGSFEIGRRNLFGTNRSVNLFTSASLYPSDYPVFDNQAPTTSSGGFGFPEYRVLGQFREPRFLGTSADFRVTGTFEQQIRSSFDFSRRSVSAEVAHRLAHRVSISGGYQIQRTRVFNQSIDPSQQLNVDRLFPKVRLSSFLGSVIRDTRNDPVDPTGGQYFSANGQLAGRAIGSEVGFAKSFFTAQTFRVVPRARGTVFAASARVGAAVGFPTALGSRDLPASERFYAGGDTTVRGFALDQLGVQHTPSRDSDTLDDAGFPLGGNALVILNGELRVPVGHGVKVVGFADVGNVFKTVTDVQVAEFKPALGFGFRYKSPVGPIRFDLGFKVPKADNQTRAEWFITFGEAF